MVSTFEENSLLVQKEKNWPAKRPGRRYGDGQAKFCSKSTRADACKLWMPQKTIVRVQYFVRGGFGGHRSRVSSKHLSSLIFRSSVFDSSGVKKGLRCSCKMHVWVSDPPKISTAAGSGYVTTSLKQPGFVAPLSDLASNSCALALQSLWPR
ncbi:hypothetical protein TNCV_132291 [Trichonephila clavipes]|nr:hypothetical protein TNCV_132291 [Trichonephila clavipes]